MAAQYAQMVLVSRNGQSTLNVDAYLDDTAGNPVRFDGGSGASATSPVQYTMPWNGYLVDFALAAATGQTKTQINRNNQSIGSVLRNSLYLASVTTRPGLKIPFAAGNLITMTQLA